MLVKRDGPHRQHLSTQPAISRVPRTAISGAVWRAAALVVVALVVVLVIVGTTHSGSHHHHAASAQHKLAWAPPIMKSPTTIELKSGFDPEHVHLSLHRDYVLKMPPGGLHGTLEIDGGHDVTLIGGHITVPNSANQHDNGADGSDVGLRIHASTGTVHVEGVLFDCQYPAKTMCDAINIDAPSANVQIENVRADDLWGTYSRPAKGDPDTGEHADAIEAWGGAKSLKVDNFTATGDYQGFTIEPDTTKAGVLSADLRNVNIVSEPIPSALASVSNGGGHMLWLTGHGTCQFGGPMSLTNFYIDDKTAGRVPPGNSVWPQVGSKFGCPAVLSGNNVSWPALTKLTGHVTLTAPPGGDFVPVGVAGNRYKSPGYIAVSGAVKP